METVITYGTFDLFHVGHVRLLKRLRELGGRLVVGLSTDEFNHLKGKQALIPYEQRREILLACRHVDDVFPESNWEQKRADILREKAAIFAMGDDWVGKFDELQDICKVVYLARTPNVSTTEIKQVLKSIRNDNVIHLRHAAENLLRMIDGLNNFER